MAYIPPHKRQSKEGDDTPVPTPSSLVPRFKNRLNLGSSSSSDSRIRIYNARKIGKLMYAKDAISKWFIEGGSTSEGIELPAVSVRMEPFRGSKSFEWKRWGEPFVLATDPRSRRGSELTSTPWESIIENIRSELLDSLGNVREELHSGEVGAVLKPSFVVRIGRILFHDKKFSGGVSSRADAESSFGQVGRSFCTNLPDSYMEAIVATVVPKIGVDSRQAKEYYHVKVHDKYNPESSISVKCRVVSGKLKLHKIELNQKRCLVVDVSCLDKDLDLRLMLSTKRGLMSSVKDDAEKLTSLRQLVDCAVLDSNAKGGVRWAMGKKFSDDGRYTVTGVWHTNKGRPDDFWASDGEVSNEVTLEVKEINGSRIAGMDMVEWEVTILILKETLKLVWDHFLSCDQ
ncbi:hypothetical protein MKW94_003412 [Papaver nudicaule]|uniref:DUF7903 domain-containing protein n=1 Tax=Papaver nudicaule TaxID=74823 RepID=A0AA41VLT6_PAPNU|nr:hypothetical protein [Papaver nudicaule]